MTEEKKCLFFFSQFKCQNCLNSDTCNRFFQLALITCVVRPEQISFNFLWSPPPNCQLSKFPNVVCTLFAPSQKSHIKLKCQELLFGLFQGCRLCAHWGHIIVRLATDVSAGSLWVSCLYQHEGAVLTRSDEGLPLFSSNQSGADRMFERLESSRCFDEERWHQTHQKIVFNPAVRIYSKYSNKLKVWKTMV